jgi:hypothetical protein
MLPNACDPLLSVHARRDEVLKPEVMRVFACNFSVYGAINDQSAHASWTG